MLSLIAFLLVESPCKLVVEEKKAYPGMVCPLGSVAVGVASIRPAKIYCSELRLSCKKEEVSEEEI